MENGAGLQEEVGPSGTVQGTGAGRFADCTTEHRSGRRGPILRGHQQRALAQGDRKPRSPQWKGTINPALQAKPSQPMSGLAATLCPMLALLALSQTGRLKLCFAEGTAL